MNQTQANEPTPAGKIVGAAKGKRSISRSNDPKLMTPSAIYKTQGPYSIDAGQRKKTVKGQGGRKMVNKTIELDGDFETYQITALSPNG